MSKLIGSRLYKVCMKSQKSKYYRTVFKMNSCIIVIGWFVLAQIQFTLCGVIQEGTNSNIKDSFGANIAQSKPQNNGKANQRDGVPAQPASMKYNASGSATSVGAGENEKVLTANEIRQRADAIRNEKYAEIETANLEAFEECYKDTQLIKKQMEKEHFIINAIRTSANRERSRAQFDGQDEKKRTPEEAKQKLEKTEKEWEAALQAADHEFVVTFADLEEKRIKAETEHKELLQEMRTEIATELKLAKDKKNQIEKKYRREKRAKDTEYYEVWEQYSAAVEAAHQKWRKTLDSIGVGEEYKAALERAALKWQEVQQKWDSIMNDARNEYQKAVDEADEISDKKPKIPAVDWSKIEERALELLRKAEDRENDQIKRVMNIYDHFEVLQNEKWKKAELEFKAAMAKANEMDPASNRGGKTVSRKRRRSRSPN